MLVNEYRLEVQFKKVQKVRNIINNIPMVGSSVGSGPYLECRPALNGLYMVFNIHLVATQVSTLGKSLAYKYFFFVRLNWNNIIHLGSWPTDQLGPLTNSAH